MKKLLIIISLIVLVGFSIKNIDNKKIDILINECIEVYNSNNYDKFQSIFINNKIKDRKEKKELFNNIFKKYGKIEKTTDYTNTSKTNITLVFKSIKSTNLDSAEGICYITKTVHFVNDKKLLIKVGLLIKNKKINYTLYSLQFGAGNKDLFYSEFIKFVNNLPWILMKEEKNQK